MAQQRKNVSEALASLGVKAEPLDVTLPTEQLPTTSFTVDGQTVELGYLGEGKPPIVKIPGCRHGQQPHNFLLQMMLGRSDVAVATMASVMERTGGPPKGRTGKATAQKSAGTWWACQNGKINTDGEGPARYTAQQVAARLASGAFGADVLVSRPGMTGWAKPSECPDIVAELPPPPPAPAQTTGKGRS